MGFQSKRWKDQDVKIYYVQNYIILYKNFGDSCSKIRLGDDTVCC